MAALLNDTLAALRGGDTAALLALGSRVLGLAVVAGSSVLKLPQIVAVLRGGAAGLTGAMFEAEVLGYSIILAAALQRALPFSAYGEVAFLLAQNAILLLLVYRAQPPPPARTALLGGFYAAAAALFVSGLARCPPGTSGPDCERFAMLVSRAYDASNLVFWYGRVPQIVANFRAKATGALSPLSTAMQCAGGAVRILTTLQAQGGLSMLLGYAVSLLLNSTLLLQCLVYGAAPAAKKRGRPPTGNRPASRRAKPTKLS